MSVDAGLLARVLKYPSEPSMFSRFSCLRTLTAPCWGIGGSEFQNIISPLAMFLVSVEFQNGSSKTYVCFRLLCAPNTILEKDYISPDMFRVGISCY
jgi:hypothetical protein